MANWLELAQQAERRRRELESGMTPYQQSQKKRFKRAEEDISLMEPEERAARRQRQIRSGLWWGSSGTAAEQQRLQLLRARRREDLAEAQKGHEERIKERVQQATDIRNRARQIGELQGEYGRPGLQQRMDDLMKQGRYGEVIGALGTYENMAGGGIMQEYARRMLPEARAMYAKSRGKSDWRAAWQKRLRG